MAQIDVSPIKTTLRPTTHQTGNFNKMTERLNVAFSTGCSQDFPTHSEPSSFVEDVNDWESSIISPQLF